MAKEGVKIKPEEVRGETPERLIIAELKNCVSTDLWVPGTTSTGLDLDD